MTVGFVAVFVVLGILFDSVADRFRENFPWVTIVVGALLVLAGFATIFGNGLRIVVPIPGAARSRGAAGMVSYGAVYALASLSCTIGPFLAITAVAMDRSVASGIATYVTYGLGMGVVILVIASASALTRPRPIDRLRRLSQYASLLGGTLMILSGAYAMWYGRWELAVYNGDLDDDRIVNAGEKLPDRRHSPHRAGGCVASHGHVARCHHGGDRGSADQPASRPRRRSGRRRPPG